MYLLFCWLSIDLACIQQEVNLLLLRVLCQHFSCIHRSWPVVLGVVQVHIWKLLQIQSVFPLSSWNTSVRMDKKVWNISVCMPGWQDTSQPWLEVVQLCQRSSLFHSTAEELRLACLQPFKGSHGFFLRQQVSVQKVNANMFLWQQWCTSWLNISIYMQRVFKSPLTYAVMIDFSAHLERLMQH